MIEEKVMDTSDPWSEGIDCFEDYDEQRCVTCIRKDECIFYSPTKTVIE